MKGNVKEIAKRITPQTSIEEMISYCNTLDDFNHLFNEYCKVREEGEHEKLIAKTIFESYDDIDEELSYRIATMIMKYESYANGRAFAIKSGEIVINEYAASRASVECGYNGEYLREIIKMCGIKEVLK